MDRELESAIKMLYYNNDFSNDLIGGEQCSFKETQWKKEIQCTFVILTIFIIKTHLFHLRMSKIFGFHHDKIKFISASHLVIFFLLHVYRFNGKSGR